MCFLEKKNYKNEIDEKVSGQIERKIRKLIPNA